jgi:hypothetical protein
MNHGETFILGIILIVMVAGIVRQYLRTRAVQPRDNPEHLARIDKLEQRVRTLERIVTDKGYDLHREFDQL